MGGIFDLSFTRMVSPSLIRIIFVLGLLLIALSSLWTLTNAFALATPNSAYSQASPSPVYGLVIITGVAILTFFQVLIWRVFCEWAIVLFLMHENLIAIKQNTSGLAPVATPYSASPSYGQAQPLS